MTVQLNLENVKNSGNINIYVRPQPEPKKPESGYQWPTILWALAVLALLIVLCLIGYFCLAKLREIGEGALAFSIAFGFYKAIEKFWPWKTKIPDKGSTES